MKDEKEFEDWRVRYAAAIERYEAMAERRRIRKLDQRAQAKRDLQLIAEGQLEQDYLDSHPSTDPIASYFRSRFEPSIAAYNFMMRIAAETGNVVATSAAASNLHRLSSKIINYAERLLWRTQKKLANSDATRNRDSSKRISIGEKMRNAAAEDTRNAAERERRKIRKRSTSSPCPSADDVRKAWLASNNTCRDIIAFGAIIHDLECYVDNSLAFDEYGDIVGREAGILGWLRENVPELAARYKTIMRYKSIAKRCRQFLGLVDPTPLNPTDPLLASFLTGCPATQKDIRERLDAALAKRSAR